MNQYEKLNKTRIKRAMQPEIMFRDLLRSISNSYIFDYDEVIKKHDFTKSEVKAIIKQNRIDDLGKTFLLDCMDVYEKLHGYGNRSGNPYGAKEKRIKYKGAMYDLRLYIISL